MTGLRRNWLLFATISLAAACIALVPAKGRAQDTPSGGRSRTMVAEK